MVYCHLDGTECLHPLTPDSFAVEGLRCTATNLDVVLDEPSQPVFPQSAPPPSRYLDGPGRRRHRAESARPGVFASWPEAMKFLGTWALFSAAILGALVGIAWLSIYVLS